MRVCDVCKTKPTDAWIEAPVKIARQEYQIDLCKECLSHANLKSLLVGIRQIIKESGKVHPICPKGLKKVSMEDDCLVYTLEGFPLTKDIVKGVVDGLYLKDDHEWMEIKIDMMKQDRLERNEEG